MDKHVPTVDMLPIPQAEAARVAGLMIGPESGVISQSCDIIAVLMFRVFRFLFAMPLYYQTGTTPQILTSTIPFVG